MSAPRSRFSTTRPRLHFLEWNPDAPRTIILLHGNSANAWWWEPVACAIAPEYRLLALDQRGHGASGGARAAMAIDVAVTSSRGRDRYLRRLKALPVVTYPDLATAKARFRLMPNEGGISDEVLHEIAEKSIARTDEGRWTLKFDRDSFLGGDGLDVLETIKEIKIPTMLVRAEHSRIMTAEAAEHARASNPRARLVTIAGAHHHVILEKPDAVARVIEEFAASL